jgi:hypothetical protein
MTGTGVIKIPMLFIRVPFHEQFCVCTQNHIAPVFFKETDYNNYVKLNLTPLFWELNKEVKK